MSCSVASAIIAPQFKPSTYPAVYPASRRSATSRHRSASHSNSSRTMARVSSSSVVALAERSR